MSDSEFLLISTINLISGDLTSEGPILNLALLYDNKTGVVNGHGELSHAISPLNGKLLLRNLTGKVLDLGHSKVTRVLVICGKFARPFPPIEPGHITEEFEAIFVTDNSWNGFGSFDYGGNTVSNVPILKALRVEE